MTPLLLVAAGLVALAAGVAVLRSFGPGFRIGRLLATTPQVTVEEARAIADRGETRYVRITGRIDAEGEFEDRDHRPLVFRRTRLASRDGRAWATFEDGREQVRFEIREGLAGIVVDADALDTGLIVVPRMSVGVAADMPDRAPTTLPPSTPVRATIEQISSVEHAIVLGIPRRTTDGSEITAGLGRPLVLTTLEPAEAMRVLTGGRSRRTRVAAALLVAGIGLLALGAVWAAGQAIA